MNALILLSITIIALTIIALKAMTVVKDTERLVVLRLGQPLCVQGSGFALLLPFIDKGVKVNLEQIAGWRRLSERDLESKLVEIALKDSA